MSNSDVISAIQKLLNPTQVLPLRDSKIVIEEDGKQARLRKVEIVIGGNAFSIKYDKCGFPGHTLFAKHDHLHKACDAIAFCEVDEKPYILCCELKSSAPTRREAVQQFLNAHCFLDYLDVLLRRYCNSQSIKGWERRYFVFHGSPEPLSKPPLKPNANCSPDAARFLQVTSSAPLYARQLLGKAL
jgi:hypothetical protein